jgi:hypothetical protein
MTDSLAVILNEPCATGCTTLADWTTACTEMDGEVLGEFIESNWDTAVGNVSGLMFLVKEMKRKFSLLDRKKQVNGEYKTIRGFTSFDKWFTSFTGKSRRLAYYLLETEEKKHKRNAGRPEKKEKDTPSTPDIFTPRIAAAKKKLTDLQHQRDNPFKDVKEGEAVDFNALYERTDPNPTITSVIQEVLALIAPEGYVILRNDNGWSLHKEEDIIEVTPEQQKAKRSAAAKKAAATRKRKKEQAEAPAKKERLRHRPSSDHRLALCNPMLHLNKNNKANEGMGLPLTCEACMKEERRQADLRGTTVFLKEEMKKRAKRQPKVTLVVGDNCPTKETVRPSTGAMGIARDRYARRRPELRSPEKEEGHQR